MFHRVHPLYTAYYTSKRNKPKTGYFLVWGLECVLKGIFRVLNSIVGVPKGILRALKGIVGPLEG